MKKKKLGNLCILLSFCFLLASIFLSVNNRIEDNQAKNASADILESIEEIAEETKEEKQEELSQNESMDNAQNEIYSPLMEMTSVSIDQTAYIGTIKIPVLQLELPVSSEWNYTQLRMTPCRYAGSIYLDNLVLCGHNYSSHFGNLNSLSQGDFVQFIDINGEVINYSVIEIEKLQSTDGSKMTEGDWDLTLFTCTLDGQERVTVRCKRNLT